MLKAGCYLRDEAVFPVPGKEKMSAVWSLPKVNNTGAPAQAWLAGAVRALTFLADIPGTP